MSLIVPSLIGGAGGSSDFEEIDVSSYYTSEYGTPYVFCTRNGRVSCLSFYLYLPAAVTFTNTSDTKTLISGAITNEQYQTDIGKKQTCYEHNIALPNSKYRRVIFEATSYRGNEEYYNLTLWYTTNGYRLDISPKFSSLLTYSSELEYCVMFMNRYE